MACKDAKQWEATLERYICDEDARREAGQKGKAFAKEQYSEERMLAQWDEVFRSILGEIDEAVAPSASRRAPVCLESSVLKKETMRIRYNEKADFA
jgi:hypothetical protein